MFLKMISEGEGGGFPLVSCSIQREAYLKIIVPIVSI